MSDDHPSPDRDAPARSSAAVAAGTLLSRVTGLVRVVALAWALGGGSLADAYNLANTTPNIVYELILGGILAATIVPIFVRQIKEHDERSTSAIFTSAVPMTQATASMQAGFRFSTSSVIWW